MIQWEELQREVRRSSSQVTSLREKISRLRAGIKHFKNQKIPSLMRKISDKDAEVRKTEEALMLLSSEHAQLVPKVFNAYLVYQFMSEIGVSVSDAFANDCKMLDNLCKLITNGENYLKALNNSLGSLNRELEASTRNLEREEDTFKNTVLEYKTAIFNMENSNRQYFITEHVVIGRFVYLSMFIKVFYPKKMTYVCEYRHFVQDRDTKMWFKNSNNNLRPLTDEQAWRLEENIKRILYGDTSQR